MKEKSRKY